mgnify:CR=1 FL=1
MTTPPDKLSQLQKKVGSLEFEKSLTSDAYFQLQNVNKKLIENRNLLQKSEMYLQATLNSTTDAILVIDNNGKVVQANKQFIKFWKIPETLMKQGSDKKLLAYVLTQLTDPDAFIKKVNELYQSKKKDLDTIYFKDGRVFDLYSTPLIIDSKNEGRVWSFRDVTKQKKAEQNLIKFETAVADAFEAVLFSDTKGNITYSNTSFQMLFGYSHEDVLKLNVSKLSANVDDTVHIFAAIGKTGYWKGDVLSVRRNGETFIANLVASPIKNIDGSVMGTMGIIQDVTREKNIDRMKTEFVSVASHQLRTPLGIMKWYLEALSENESIKNLPADVLSYFSEIKNSNDRVLALVRELLTVSRIDQGQVKDIPKLVDVKALLKDVLLQMRVVARKKVVNLSLIIHNGNIPLINIDTIRLQETIENLIENGIEYTPTGGSVTVILSRVGNSIVIRFEDTGIGISEGDKKNLFTKFFRSEEAVKNNPGGLGLGLYVVKSYVEGWGGKVSVQSVYKKGSTFTITLPIKTNIKGGDKE